MQNINYSEGLKGLSPANQGILRLDSKELAFRRTKQNAQRLDSLAPGNGLHLARELEFAYQELLREQYKPLTALENFPVDRRVPEGALTYKIARISHQGDAKYHRGNSYDIPRSGASVEEEIRPIRHIVTMIELDMFEQQASNFAGSNLRAELREGAVRAMREFLNQKTWFGSEADDVYGVLNYPFVPKATSSVTIDSSSDADTILAELHRLANLSIELSDGTFSPDTMLLPIKTHNYVSTTKRSATTDQTILEAFKQNSAVISEVKPVPELKAAGPSGQDVILFYRRNDQRAISNVVPKEFTMLPVQEQNFSLSIPCYMSHGGVMMRDPLNNLVVYTPAT